MESKNDGLPVQPSFFFEIHISVKLYLLFLCRLAVKFWHSFFFICIKAC
jgi:hypothetical protein